MGWASFNEDNESRYHNATIIRKREHDAMKPESSIGAQAPSKPLTKLKSFAVPQARPLPVIVLADVSGSMAENGKIDALNVALRDMVASFAKEGRLRAEMLAPI
jgi:Mg-chelatase subunit ChlD